jgi:hypothetical protein
MKSDHEYSAGGLIRFKLISIPVEFCSVLESSEHIAFRLLYKNNTLLKHEGLCGIEDIRVSDNDDIVQGYEEKITASSFRRTSWEKSRRREMRGSHDRDS